MPCMYLFTISLSDGKRNLIMKWSTTPIMYFPPPPPHCQKKTCGVNLSCHACIYVKGFCHIQKRQYYCIILFGIVFNCQHAKKPCHWFVSTKISIPIPERVGGNSECLASQRPNQRSAKVNQICNLSPWWNSFCMEAISTNNNIIEINIWDCQNI